MASDAYSAAVTNVRADEMTQIAAKYIFVRVLRGTRHLQKNTAIHWVTWLCCTFGIATMSFVFSQAIPIFNYLNCVDRLSMLRASGHLTSRMVVALRSLAVPHGDTYAAMHLVVPFIIDSTWRLSCRRRNIRGNLGDSRRL